MKARNMMYQLKPEFTALFTNLLKGKPLTPQEAFADTSGPGRKSALNEDEAREKVELLEKLHKAEFVKKVPLY